METFTSYQDLSSLCDIPVPAPLPVSPFYLSWTIPLSFNFTFPELELPSRCQDNFNGTPAIFSVPAMETFTGSQGSPLNAPSQIHLPENVPADMSNLPSLPNSYRSPVPSPTSSSSSSPPSTILTLCDQAITAQSMYDEQQSITTATLTELLVLWKHSLLIKIYPPFVTYQSLPHYQSALSTSLGPSPCRLISPFLSWNYLPGARIISTAPRPFSVFLQWRRSLDLRGPLLMHPLRFTSRRMCLLICLTSLLYPTHTDLPSLPLPLHLPAPRLQQF